MPLSKSESITFLNAPHMAHVATSTTSGRSRVTPIWFVYDGGCFYFTTRLGRLKGRHIQQNPWVAISIATDERPYRAVCAFGKAKIVQQNRDKWLERISSKYGEREGRSWLAKAAKQHDRVVLMLKPNRVLSWHYGRGDSERQERGESMVTPT